MDGLALLMDALQVLIAAMLCFADLSYRKTTELLGSVSYMAVQGAFIAMESLPRPERHRRCVAVDETKVKIVSMHL